jgi:hypothetical protein
MDSEMEQKYYQALKDSEDIKGSKLLVFQVYLINLGGLSCPRLCWKKESPKSEDRHTMSKGKRTSCMFVFVCYMVFNATFNNISVISWRSALLVEETGVSGENHRLVVSHRQTVSHNVVSGAPRH